MTARLPLVLVGGGGHASDVLQAIEAINDVTPTFHVVGILDDAEVEGRRFAGRGVTQIGSVDAIAKVAAAYVVCVGWPWIRDDLVRRIGDQGDPAPPIIHPKADIGVGAEFAPGTVVLGQAHVSPLARLGAHSLVSYNASVGHDTTFGSCASVMPNAAVSGDVRAGDRVLIGSGAVVRERIRLGDDVRVGAGAAVVADVPDGVTVVGVPARPAAGP